MYMPARDKQYFYSCLGRVIWIIKSSISRLNKFNQLSQVILNQIQMRSDSIFENHEETKLQRKSGVIALMKTYRLYVFLQRQRHENANNLCSVQKLELKLKEQRMNRQQKLSEYSKNIQLSFHDFGDQTETYNALLELKNQGPQNKIRIIFYGNESSLIKLCENAKQLNIKIENIPLVLYSIGLNKDFSAFLGWGKSYLGTILTKSLSELEPEIRKWIKSPIQKIDTWTVDIYVHQDIGQIYRIDNTKNQQFIENQKSISIGFISHLSIGYHPKLNYHQRSQIEPSFFDKVKYKMESLRNFCCVGSPNMKAATGVVNVKFLQENGQEREVFKEFKDYSENQDQTKHTKYTKKRILSIVITNIDRYNGEKLRQNQNFKMNDGKLQLHTFQSLSSSTKIASISGDIKITLESQQSVFIQINNQTIRLINPKQIIIRKAEQRKVIINKDTLQC